MDTQSLDDDIRIRHHWFGVECNNEAWRLAELKTRTTDECDSMLNNAHAAAYHWSIVGTEDNKAKAWALLAQAHALAGNGPIAVRYAAKSFEYVTANNSPDWEIAFAHLIMANAACASGDGSKHALYYTSAQELGNAIIDSDDKGIFMKSFANVPRP